jgi:outer membrane immunogenic protein
MKKLVLAIALAAMTVNGAALAADLPVRAPAYKVAYAPFSWTGFYVGVHGGGDWFSKDWFLPATANNIAGGCLPGCPTNAGSHTATSWLAGAQVGFNYQISWFVGGIEAQYSATRLQGSNLIPNFPAVTVNTKTDGVGTLAARLGIAMDRSLFFVKGGAAWSHDTFWSSTTANGVTLSTVTDTRWGWMIGVGWEWAFLDNWSVKVEYDHMDFRRRRETLLPVTGVTFDYDIEQTVDLVKVGVNYRFGYAPVVAKY